MPVLQTVHDRAALVIAILATIVAVSLATSFVVNLVIAFFGLYYLLGSGPQLWATVRGYSPFSARASDAVLNRFFGVTEAKLFGTALIAVLQGTLIGTGF